MKRNSNSSWFNFILISSIIVGMSYCNFCAAATSSTSITTVLGISFRMSNFISNTAVLQIKNKTKHDIKNIRLKYTNLNSGEKMTYKINIIKQGKTKEIGFFESGWTIEPDEVIVISINGYAADTFHFWKDNQGKFRMSNGYIKKKIGQTILKLKQILQ